MALFAGVEKVLIKILECFSDSTKFAKNIYICTGNRTTTPMKKKFMITTSALALTFTIAFAGPARETAPSPVKAVSVQQERAIPAHSYIYISSKYALEMIEIFDDQGNLYEKIPLQATTYYALDIRKWPLGVYTLKVTNNISTIKRKILKVR